MIKPSVICLSGGNHFIQKCIRYFTKSNFSHSFMVFDGPVHLDVIETTSSIVKVAPFANKESQPDHIMVWEMTQASPEEIQAATVETYKEYSGCKYGYASYLWFIYRWLSRKFGKDKTRMWKWASHNVTCTELTCYTIAKLKNYAHLFVGRDINTYAPEELHELMKSNKDLFKFIGWYREIKG